MLYVLAMAVRCLEMSIKEWQYDGISAASKRMLPSSSPWRGGFSLSLLVPRLWFAFLAQIVMIGDGFHRPSHRSFRIRHGSRAFLATSDSQVRQGAKRQKRQGQAPKRPLSTREETTGGKANEVVVVSQVISALRELDAAEGQRRYQSCSLAFCQLALYDEEQCQKVA